MKCDASPVTGLLHKPGKPDIGRRRYRSKTDRNIETIYCGWYGPASLPPQTEVPARTTDVAPSDGAMMTDGLSQRLIPGGVSQFPSLSASVHQTGSKWGMYGSTQSTDDQSMRWVRGRVPRLHARQTMYAGWSCNRCGARTGCTTTNIRATSQHCRHCVECSAAQVQ